MKKSLKTLQKKCDDFNKANPVGSSVVVRLDGEVEPFRTKTKTKAQVLQGHSAVIWLDEVSGCYLLDRVTAAN